MEDGKEPQTASILELGTRREVTVLRPPGETRCRGDTFLASPRPLLADPVRNQVARGLGKSKLQGSSLTDIRKQGRSQDWIGGREVRWRTAGRGRPQRCLEWLEISSLLENEGRGWNGCN